MPMSSSVRRAASVVGGLLALASGAATAELTQAATRTTPPPITEGVLPTGVVADAPTPTLGGAAIPVATAPRREPAGASQAQTLEHEAIDAPRFPGSVDAASSNLRDGRIITGATPHRFILFTFDDGPDPRYTRDLLDALDEADVRAVFFLTTRRFEGDTPYARSLAAITREIVARGHRVGSHSMDHVQLPLVPTPELATQVDESARLIAAEAGASPALLRPPGGSRSPRIDGYLATHGYTQVLWNLGTGDVQVRSPGAVLDTFARVLEVRERDHGERGGIVLLHDIHAWSVEAFPRIVAYLDRRNCDLLDAGEELYDFVDDPAYFYEARHEGDAADAVAAPQLPREILATRQIRARARAELRCADRDALDALISGAP